MSVAHARHSSRSPDEGRQIRVELILVDRVHRVGVQVIAVGRRLDRSMTFSALQAGSDALWKCASRSLVPSCT
jgi:hypothetical protein